MLENKWFKTCICQKILLILYHNKRLIFRGKRPPDVVGRKIAFNVKRLYQDYES